MPEWQYRTVTVESTTERDIDLDVEAKFDELQGDGWEYVSGPVIEKFSGGERDYTFMIRRKRRVERSAYEDGGVTVL